ncbi:putative fatty acid elongation protein 4 isoform X2 [Folsomia candida]|uniref:putative fatty acid elongation protein 4 isoform X2 n=1 Tax=Folsomia candida TaxID=158441 RepID=UPI000B8EEA42|nr:putative fatty acid elongation protein 4 isoform X2 [Folsomia candida]
MLHITDLAQSWFFPDFDTSYVEWDYTKNQTIEPFAFERDYIDFPSSRKFWWKNSRLIIQISVIYVLLVHSLAWWMKTRKPFDLRKELFAWNVALALFSVVGCVRVFTELWDVLTGQNGFHRSICVRDTLNISTGFWNVAIPFSKLAEFVDTTFIVLRKRPLTFLHVYHHAVTFVLSVTCTVQGEPIVRYYGSVNLMVHTFMYTYFALSAIDYKPSRKFAMCLTTLQILQFVTMLGAHGYAISVKLTGQPCAISRESCVVTTEGI